MRRSGMVEGFGASAMGCRGFEAIERGDGRG